MSWRGTFLEHDPEDEPDELDWMQIPPGYHQRVTICFRRKRRSGAFFVMDGSGKARQIGPIPLPFKHRNRGWR